MDGLEYDEEEFAKLFTKSPTVSKETKEVGSNTQNPNQSAMAKRKARKSIQLIDSRRQMNGCILLAK
jgi:hypothetical protein